MNLKIPITNEKEVFSIRKKENLKKLKGDIYQPKEIDSIYLKKITTYLN